MLLSQNHIDPVSHPLSLPVLCFFLPTWQMIFQALTGCVMESAVTRSPGHPVYLSRAPEQRSISHLATPSPPFDPSQSQKPSLFLYVFIVLKPTQHEGWIKMTARFVLLGSSGKAAKPHVFLPEAFLVFRAFPAILSDFYWIGRLHTERAWKGMPS